MRVLLLLLLILVPGVAVNAQDLPIELVKYSWSKERLNWEGNPFGGPNENFHQMQFRSRSEKRVSDAKRSNSPEVGKLEKEAKADAAIVANENQNSAPPRYYFMYRASMKNLSTKQIKEIDWDYIFADVGTGEELDRRQFTSVQNIGPGKQKELTFTILTPPTRRVSVYALDKKERLALAEKVIIVRITYADGSVWELK